MIAPDIALQGAVVAKVKADVAAINGQFYDAVPHSAVKPYVTVGEFQVIDDGADCFDDSVEIFMTLHTWSGPFGRPAGQGGAMGSLEAKAINGAIVASLKHAELDLSPDWRLVGLEFRDSRTFTDADGKTAHGVITFRAMLDPA